MPRTCRSGCGTMGILERTQAVLDATRKRGMLVVYINGVHAPGYPELGARTVPLAAMLISRGSMQKGTWGVEVIDELKPIDGEILLDNYSPERVLLDAARRDTSRQRHHQPGHQRHSHACGGGVDHA